VSSELVIFSVIPAGVLADRYGVPIVVGTLAALVVVVHLATAILVPSIRKLS